MDYWKSQFSFLVFSDFLLLISSFIPVWSENIWYDFYSFKMFPVYKIFNLENYKFIECKCSINID